MFLLGKWVHPLTSQLKAGGFPGESSIPVWFIGNTVGKVESESCSEYVIAEEEKDLFPKSLMGAIIQDGGSRERNGECDHDITLTLTLSLENKNKSKGN